MDETNCVRKPQIEQALAEDNLWRSSTRWASACKADSWNQGLRRLALGMISPQTVSRYRVYYSQEKVICSPAS